MTPDEIADIRRWHEASKGLADGRPFLGDRRLDAFVDVMLEMAAQLWVSRRRNAVLEAVLAERGLVPPEALEQFTFDEAATADQRAARAQYVATVFRSLAELPQTPNSPDQEQSA